MNERMLADRYQLQEELGQGGMGVVCRAWDRLLERHVAVKVVSPTLLGTEGRERLLQEAQAAAALNHPNIVAIYDVAQDGDSPFIVMELVEGKTLDQWESPGLQEDLTVAGQIVAALDSAHSQGVIHRDLKPQNILLTAEGLLKLTDFDLARLIGKTRITREGSLMGTFTYLAPELILGQEASPQSDLYAFGIVLYELVAGRPPFDDESPTAILTQHIHAPVVPPSSFNPEISPALDGLIIELLAKRPEDRPRSAALVAQTLTMLQSETAAEVATELSDRPGSRLQLERLVRGRMVGRKKAFDQAVAIWREAAAGKGQLLLLSGEPGIGKTRFAQELTTYAEISGGRVLFGQCYASGSVPYMPFGQMIRSLFENDLLSDLSESVTADLLTLAPDLKHRLRNRPVSASHLDEGEQTSLYRSIYALCQSLTAQGPLLLFVDDIHWADSGSLGLLLHIAHQAANQPLLILATYREAELTEKRPARQMIAELSRERRTQRIKLSRLDRQQTGLMLGNLLAEEINPELLDGIYRETEGNPFFIEEVCRALIDSGELIYADGRWQRQADRLTIPQGVQLAIESRLERLDSQEREILQIAALFGRDFRYDMLLVANPFDEDVLISGLENAERFQLIEEIPHRGFMAGPAEFTFTHALIQATLLSGLSTLRRQRLQSRIAQALEANFPERAGEMAPLLGQFFAEAGIRPKAIQYLLQAGDAARQVYAYQEAIEAYEQALLFLREGDETDLTARTLLKLGLAYHATLAFEKSRQAYDEGFALHRLDAESLAADQKQSAHILRYSSSAKPITLDPAQAVDAVSCMVCRQLFAGLVKLTPEGEILPELARRWQVLEDGRLYLFHLRQDGYWSDGRPVTAQDFVVGWRRNLSPSMALSPASLLFDIKGARAYYEGLSADPEQIGVSASDDYTLVVELEAPAGYFLQILGLPQLMPVPAHKIDELGDDWAKTENIVSNGPLRLKQDQSAQRMDFEPNSGYPGSASGNVAGASLIIADPTETRKLYDSGQLDAVAVTGFFPDDLSIMTRRWPDEVVSVPNDNTMYYWFDVRQTPFDDRRVRRAFALATDRKILAAKTSALAFSAAAGGLVPPGIPGHVPDLALPYDPAQARALLAEAGYPDGQGFPASTIVSTGDGMVLYLVSELQRQWQKNLGLWIDFDIEELGRFAQRQQQDPPGIWLLGWLADYPDPDNYLRVSSWRQTGYWTHPDYERIIEEARRLTDQGQRMELYRQAEQILADEAPVVPLVYPSNFLLVKPWVKQLPMSYVGPDMARAIVVDPPVE